MCATCSSVPVPRRDRTAHCPDEEWTFRPPDPGRLAGPLWPDENRISSNQLFQTEFVFFGLTIKIEIRRIMVHALCARLVFKIRGKVLLHE